MDASQEVTLDMPRDMRCTAYNGQFLPLNPASKDFSCVSAVFIPKVSVFGGEEYEGIRNVVEDLAKAYARTQRLSFGSDVLFFPKQEKFAAWLADGIINHPVDVVVMVTSANTTSWALSATILGNSSSQSGYAAFSAPGTFQQVEGWRARQQMWRRGVEEAWASVLTGKDVTVTIKAASLRAIDQPGNMFYAWPTGMLILEVAGPLVAFLPAIVIHVAVGLHLAKEKEEGRVTRLVRMGLSPTATMTSLWLALGIISAIVALIGVVTSRIVQLPAFAHVAVGFPFFFLWLSSWAISSTGMMCGAVARRPNVALGLSTTSFLFQVAFACSAFITRALWALGISFIALAPINSASYILSALNAGVFRTWLDDVNMNPIAEETHKGYWDDNYYFDDDDYYNSNFGTGVYDFALSSTGKTFVSWQMIALLAPSESRASHSFYYALPNVLTLLAIIFFHALCIFLFAAYLIQVCARDANQPWYFPFSCHYWCGSEHATASEFAKAEANVEAQLTELSEREGSLRIHKVSVVFADKVQALHEVSLTLAKGQVFALIGSNGAGKSTLVNVIAGQEKTTAGTVLLSGLSLSGDRDRYRQRVSVCEQDDVLWPQMTPREHVALAMSLRGLHPSREQVEAALGEVQLEIEADTIVAQLSGGLRRRVSVAMALAGPSELLILDECTTGLDPATKTVVWKAVERAKTDRIILLTTHDLMEAEALGDNVGILLNGRLRAMGSPRFLTRGFGQGTQLSIHAAGDEELARRVRHLARTKHKEGVVVVGEPDEDETRQMMRAADPTGLGVGIRGAVVAENTLADDLVSGSTKEGDILANRRLQGLVDLAVASDGDHMAEQRRLYTISKLMGDISSPPLSLSPHKWTARSSALEEVFLRLATEADTVNAGARLDRVLDIEDGELGASGERDGGEAGGGEGGGGGEWGGEGGRGEEDPSVWQEVLAVAKFEGVLMRRKRAPQIVCLVFLGVAYLLTSIMARLYDHTKKFRSCRDHPYRMDVSNSTWWSDDDYTYDDDYGNDDYRDDDYYPHRQKDPVCNKTEWDLALSVMQARGSPEWKKEPVAAQPPRESSDYPPKTPLVPEHLIEEDWMIPQAYYVSNNPPKMLLGLTGKASKKAIDWDWFGTRSITNNASVEHLAITRDGFTTAAELAKQVVEKQLQWAMEDAGILECNTNRDASFGPFYKSQKAANHALKNGLPTGAIDIEEATPSSVTYTTYTWSRPTPWSVLWYASNTTYKCYGYVEASRPRNEDTSSLQQLVFSAYLRQEYLNRFGDLEVTGLYRPVVLMPGAFFQFGSLPGVKWEGDEDSLFRGYLGAAFCATVLFLLPLVASDVSNKRSKGLYVQLRILGAHPWGVWGGKMLTIFCHAFAWATLLVLITTITTVSLILRANWGLVFLVIVFSALIVTGLGSLMGILAGETSSNAVIASLFLSLGASALPAILSTFPPALNAIPLVGFARMCFIIFAFPGESAIQIPDLGGAIVATLLYGVVFVILAVYIDEVSPPPGKNGFPAHPLVCFDWIGMERYRQSCCPRRGDMFKPLLINASSIDSPHQLPSSSSSHLPLPPTSGGVTLDHLSVEYEVVDARPLLEIGGCWESIRSHEDTRERGGGRERPVGVLPAIGAALDYVFGCAVFVPRIRRKVVHDITLQVHPGECLGVLGPNGSGKTSMLSVLAGKVAASKGQVLVGGVGISGSLSQRRLVGVLRQDDYLFEDATVAEHLFLAARLGGTPEAAVSRRSEDLAAQVRLDGDELVQPAGSLPAGQRRRLSLAMTLAGNSSVLSLDEPACGLDPESKRALWFAIKRAKATGVALLLSSHGMDEVEVLSDKVALLDEGNLRFFGTTESLRQRTSGHVLISIALSPGNGETGKQFLTRLLHLPNEDSLHAVPTLDPHYEAFYLEQVEGLSHAAIAATLSSTKDPNLISWRVGPPALDQAFIHEVGGGGEGGGM